MVNFPSPLLDAHISELQRERLSLQQDGERDRERIRTLKKELAEARETAGKFNEEDVKKAREAEKAIWMEKIAQMRHEDEGKECMMTCLVGYVSHGYVGVRAELRQMREQLMSSQDSLQRMTTDRDGIQANLHAMKEKFDNERHRLRQEIDREGMEFISSPYVYY